ncbi:transcriptional regulator yeeY [Klebsiella pneumoniae]|uniref:Transcriptional regulator yeeY n=1 Tax=Klebsiella pneumoniae TaxID=573 RepID=A0A2X3EZ73_KLEPN|nr:transcriptional regulator yeeY [Klebsiella pneumoniae]
MCDAAGQLALLRLGLGWGCLPRYQVQGSAGQRRAGLHDRARAVASSTRVDRLE